MSTTTRPVTPTTASTAPRDPNAALIGRLNKAAAKNAYAGSLHNCYQFSRTTVLNAGGRDIGSLPDDRSARGQGVAHLQTMIEKGKLRPGDVIYANYRPGTDPQSLNLSNGPHWFTYLGHGKFADQYGIKNLKEMVAFIPGRKIDAVVHPFKGVQSEGTPPAAPPKPKVAADSLAGSLPEQAKARRAGLELSGEMDTAAAKHEASHQAALTPEASASEPEAAPPLPTPVELPLETPATTLEAAAPRDPDPGVRTWFTR